MPSKRLKYLPHYLAISPFFILFAVFGAYPVLYSLYLAFQRWDGIGPTEFIGISNFEFLVTDLEFWNSVGNTFIIWIMSTVPMTILALLIAVGLNSAVRFKGAYRIAYFTPNVTSIVAMSIVFSSIFSPEFGILNAFMSWLGLDPVEWSTDPWGIKIAISVMIIWRWVGYNAIIFLAGLQAIPQEMYEAAKIDGAGPIQTFFKVTLPLLRPVLLFSVVMSAINGLQIFAEAQILVGERGGPEDAGMTMVLYFYNQAFLENDFGYGAAIAWGIFVIVLLFAIINWRLINRPERAEVKK
ncbi:sugar ABC transporter permease [Kibdelosporangium philippinense]|uniref:Sugar ABC transporter permease n=1 Tax=Kibdelosporangium philippinense TaxID=211113 RepID=A0ABS8Z4D3_9PSEU|nr:sugar ABC transporter permease [Kibdelosporangium philippinense]MCE7002690.1 sugar ABC transporter permease [Kibdelosporangium philippinense]